MHVKPKESNTLRSFATRDTAVGKVEEHLGGALENHAHDLHWMVVETDGGRYVPVFFSVGEKSKWLARSIADHGWPFYG